MTVKELIKELNKWPSSSEVCFEGVTIHDEKVGNPIILVDTCSLDKDNYIRAEEDESELPFIDRKVVIIR